MPSTIFALCKYVDSILGMFGCAEKPSICSLFLINEGKGMLAYICCALTQPRLRKDDGHITAEAAGYR